MTKESPTFSAKRWACKALDEDNPEALLKRLPKDPKEWERLDDTGYSLLETSLTAKALKCTKELLRRGISVETGASNFPPLSTLLAQGELSKNHQRIYGLLTALIGQGADVNALDASGSSCLHVAAKGEIGRALRPLWEGTENVKVVPNPNLPDHQLDTPTHAIFQVPHTPKEVVEWLNWCGASGADWSLKNSNEETPVFLAFHNNTSWTNKARWKVLDTLAFWGARVEKEKYLEGLPPHGRPEESNWAQWERLALRRKVLGHVLENQPTPYTTAI